MPGLCIFAAAFMLSWAAELAQFYIPQSLAIVFLALIAILPEYAIDMYFAWTAGKNPIYIQYAAANMTGANRLLIGLGWALVVLLYWLKTRHPKISLEPSHKLEINTLLIATIYSFTLPLKGHLELSDTIILIAIFLYYAYQASKLGVHEPEIEEGPTKILCSVKEPWRTVNTLLLFAISGLAIYTSAEPFAEGLLELGESFKIDQFILVQWIAPLASESPELIVAILFALKSKPELGLQTVISSTINQWTLLVGMLPLVYNISVGKIMPMVLDVRQTEELLLTASQSLYALLVISNLTFSVLEGFVLFTFFTISLLFPSTTVRFIFSGLYIIKVFFQKRLPNSIMMKKQNNFLPTDILQEPVLIAGTKMLMATNVNVVEHRYHQPSLLTQNQP
ncbi:MAG: sodium:calcium antiporter [Bacteroidia bacterium]|nr:sodium:calcium antiporter [Bacteroidia bacterium]